MNDDNPLVYSTAGGRIKEQKIATGRAASDGTVRLLRQTAGRKGKGVTLISGIDANVQALEKLAAELKKICACGGSVKNGVIEIQSDRREQIKQLLEAKGMKVKLAGG